MAVGHGPTVGHYRFEGWDLPTKYEWMHSGVGAQAAREVQDIVLSMAERITASGERVSTLLDGAEWAGAAATAAGEAMRRGAGEMTYNAITAASAEQCVVELGESFQNTQHRVPAPNEVPSGMGSRFLYNAAERFNAVSPFDVQSPLHNAMGQRRELDHQANLALTDHMNRSRERVEAIPPVTPAAPMTVAAQSAAPAGAVSAGHPTAVAPESAGGAAPAATSSAGWSGAPSSAPAAGPLPAGGAHLPAESAPVSTGLAGVTGAGTAAGRSGAPGSAVGTAAPGAGGAAGLAPVGGRVGGPAGAGVVRSAPGGPGAGVSALGRGGASTGGAGGVAGTGAAAGSGGAGRAGAAASFLHPPLAGRGGSDEDNEHRNRYALPADNIVGNCRWSLPR